MKKIYILFLGVLVSSAAMTQSANSTNAQNFRSFTKTQISPMVAPKGHFNFESFFKSVDLLNEDFEGPNAPGLPDGWSTSEVADADVNTIDAFIVADDEQANIGGYWPVPETGTDNLFAQANDDGPPCDCDMSLIELILPELDFSDVGNAAITFDIFHDMGFGGGDATLEVSTDGGSAWDVLSATLPVDETLWQTIVLPLYDYAGEGSVTIRFTWTDAGSWASGFAVDNVIVGEIADYNLTADKVVFGDWNQVDFGAGVYKFSQIPLGQASEIRATAVIANNGFFEQENVDFELQILFNGNPEGGIINSDNPSALQESLTKDTLSVVSSFIPTATGTVSIEMTAISTTGDDNDADNMATKSMEITENTYARDDNAAQAFVDPGSAYEFGNLFDFYADQMVGGIDYAVGAGTDVGAVIYGTIYEFLGLDDNGDPMLDFIGISTTFYEIQDADLNGVGEANFVTLPFEDGAQMFEADKTYLAVVVTQGDVVRTPVSGTNEWVVSWMNDGEWGATLSIPMVRLNMDPTVGVDEVAEISSLELMNTPNPATDNTTISFNLSSADKVSLQVYDMNGKLVVSENLGVMTSGVHNYELNVSAYEAGMYNYTLVVGDITVTNKMIIE